MRQVIVECSCPPRITAVIVECFLSSSYHCGDRGVFLSSSHHLGRQIVGLFFSTPYSSFRFGQMSIESSTFTVSIWSDVCCTLFFSCHYGHLYLVIREFSLDLPFTVCALVNARFLSSLTLLFRSGQAEVNVEFPLSFLFALLFRFGQASIESSHSPFRFGQADSWSFLSTPYSSFRFGQMSIESSTFTVSIWSDVCCTLFFSCHYGHLYLVIREFSLDLPFTVCALVNARFLSSLTLLFRSGQAEDPFGDPQRSYEITDFLCGNL
ncbi:hypothetical protein M5K25_019716 [Dendrobium thyrsiflorum]|uniref:Uncharacterized protein n=1 Tax=Dendrobium thyrsiflorum TaxID=117978 RepID=A0ABD0UFN2_DENTH